MMNINEFTNEVKAKLENILIGVEVEEVDFTKDNDTNRTGLCIKSGEKTCSPVFYMDNYYDLYLLDEGVDSIVNLIADTYMGLDDPEYDLSWDAIKDKITLRVLELERNKDRVKDCPYVYLEAGFIGLADVVFDNGRGIINHGALGTFPVDDAELFDIAKNNMDVARPVLLSPDMSENLLVSGDINDDMMCFVLTTEKTVYGASALFCGDVMHRIYSLLGEYYVIPSSVHEVFIIPKDKSRSVSDLKTLLYTGNRTVCEKDEILSDNVLYFDGDTLRVV